MRRREFIAGFGAAAAWPIVARGQEKLVPVIGFLNTQSADTFTPEVAAFQKGLNETGYIEGQNVTVEYRWADGHYERLRFLAADLLNKHPSVIAATGGSPAGLAAKAVTTTVPIIFDTGYDPVKAGLVISLSRPAENATGISHTPNLLGPKLLEMLRELLRADTPIALLVNLQFPTNGPYSSDIQAAANAIGQRLHIVTASTETEINNAFLKLVQLGCGGLVVASEPFLATRRNQIIALSARNKIPAIYPGREFVTAGGLMSYGIDILDVYRQVGIYVGRILKGDKPGDLPVVQGVKIDLVLNNQTANALGITFPPSVLARADEVIE
jgi:putative tryptophan/tyrosine transport system substrate-binding protein